jgi:hypothetical protein
MQTPLRLLATWSCCACCACGAPVSATLELRGQFTARASRSYEAHTAPITTARRTEAALLAGLSFEPATSRHDSQATLEEPLRTDPSTHSSADQNHAHDECASAAACAWELEAAQAALSNFAYGARP